MLLTSIAGSAHATEVGYGRKFGLGFVLGDPTGLSAKWWIGATNALDFGLGFWGYGVNDRCFDNSNLPAVRLQQRHVQHGLPLAVQHRARHAQLDWHVGAGGRASGGAATAPATASPSRRARLSASI